MKKRIMILLMMSAFLVFGAGNARALLMADIAYDYTDNGGGNYTFDFTVSNNSNEPSMLDLFEIEFDADVITNYSNITWNNDQGWDHTEADDPDAGFGGLPGYVLADDYSGAGGIAAGGQVSGFTVTFDYAGILNAALQLFSYEAWFSDLSGNFIGKDFGITRYEGVQPVPEPATMMLLGTGLLGFFGFQRKVFKK
jgi:hypothetical protein